MSARDDVLAAVRGALGPGRDEIAAPDGATSDALPVPGRAPERADRAAMLDLFAERVADYRATVTRCSATDLVVTVTSALEGAASVVVPPGLELDLPGAVVGDGLTHA